MTDGRLRGVFVAPVGESTVHPRSDLLQGGQAADQFHGHIRPCQWFGVANVREEHGMSTDHVADTEIPPAWLFVQFGADGVFGAQRLANRILDRIFVVETVDGVPLAGIGIKANAAAFDFDTEIAGVGVAHDKISLTILGVFVFAPQDPADPEEDGVFGGKLVAQSAVDLGFGGRFQRV